MSETFKQRYDVIRPLSISERFNSAMHETHFQLGIVLSCRYTVPSSIEQSSIEKFVEQAIAHTVLDHPLLYVGVVGEGTQNPVWVRLKTLDLGSHVRWREVDTNSLEAYDRAFNQTIQTEVDSPFVDLETRPAWSVIVLKSTGSIKCIEVIFSFNHLVSDGVGARIFHDSLLKHLHLSALSNSQSKDMQLKDGILTLPAMTSDNFISPDEFSTFSYSAFWAIKTLWGALRPSMFAPTSNTLYMPMRLDIPKVTGWRLFTIGIMESAKVLEACRKNNTTLTGLLQALTLVAFSAQIPEDQGKVFKSETSVNLRRFANRSLNPDKSMMSMVTLCYHDFDQVVVERIREQLAVEKLDSSTGKGDELERIVWEIAAGVRSQISQKLQLGTHNDITGLKKFVSDPKKLYLQTAEKPRITAWNISNIGVISSQIPNQITESSENTWLINRCIFAQSVFSAGAGYEISVSGVHKGSVSICCSWQEGVISNELGNSLSRIIETWLIHLVGKKLLIKIN